MAATTGQTDVKAVKEFFGMDLPDLKDEWPKGGLTSKDREQIAGGSGDSSLIYADRGPGPPWVRRRRDWCPDPWCIA